MSSSSMGIGDRILVVGAILSLFVLIPRFADHGLSGGMTQAPIVGKIYPQDPVRRRHSKTLRWEEVRETSDVYLRDMVYTPKNARVEVKLANGSHAILPPDSLIQFDEVTLDNLQIALKERQTPPKERFLPLPRRSRIGELGDAAELAFLQDALTRRLNSLLAREIPPLVLPKIRQLAAPPKMEGLRDFEVRLVRPRIGESFSMGSTQWITMKWTTVPLPGVVFELQVSRSAVFSPLVTYQTKAEELSIQVDDSGAYYWRVAAQHGGRSILSDSGTFTVVSARSDPSQTVSASLAGYALELARDPKFQTIVKTSVGTTPQCPRKGLVAGRYYCRASSVDGSSGLREYSFEVR